MMSAIVPRSTSRDINNSNSEFSKIQSPKQPNIEDEFDEVCLKLLANLIVSLQLNFAWYNIMTSYRRQIVLLRSVVLSAPGPIRARNRLCRSRKILDSTWSNKRVVGKFCQRSCVARRMERF